MIKVVAKCIVKAEEIQKFKQYTSELIEQTRKEAGNISYALYEDIEDSQVLTFIEEWQDKEALDHHMRTRHFCEILPKLKRLQQKETEMNVYQEC